METVWFCLLAIVAAVYGILDGYDLGVGILSPFVGRTHQERAAAHATILPVWDGNEVWLIAGGAILFFVFPAAYAAAFAGFYLAFFVLLWLLIPRGLALEMRGHVEHPLWRDFCDGVFFAASLALGLVYGVALGNVLRGVPLDQSGYFFVPFWTVMGLGPRPGVFDWYTVLIGLGGLAVLVVHGGAFLAFRSAEPIRRRALAAMRRGALPAASLVIAAVLVTPWVNPWLLHNYWRHPWAYAVPAAAGLSILAMVVLAWARRALATFIASSLLILLLVASAALSLYPALLVATTDRAYDLTIHNSATTQYGMAVGLIWGAMGLVLASLYSAFAHYLFRRRVSPVEAGHG